MKILMCPPDYYGIEYEINPWMKLANKANQAQAIAQWNSLYQLIEACGAEITLMKPVPGCPDMTFTANAGLLYRDRIVLSHFKYAEREREAAHFETWFKQAGFTIENPTASHAQTAHFEGAGDALNNGDLLFV